jgi:CheY-like chemotaxis protein
MGTCVVVVEDEPSVLEMLRDLLTMNGYSVVPVSYPELVHTIDPDLHPDVFLLDVMLPGMSGVELAAQLRTCGFEETPMIAMSASPLMLELAAASKLFRQTVAKPFDITKLLDAIVASAA